MPLYFMKFRTVWGNFSLMVQSDELPRDTFIKNWNGKLQDGPNGLAENQFRQWVVLKGSIDLAVICDVFNPQICQFEEKEVIFYKQDNVDNVRLAINEAKIFKCIVH